MGFGISCTELLCVFQHDVHELIEPSQYTLHLPMRVQLDCKGTQSRSDMKNIRYTDAKLGL